MSLIWMQNDLYRIAEYQSEADLESAIIQVQSELFGPNRIYLDVKKKIGTKGGLRNIPDGYLIDLNGRTPRLYVIENELASHDPLRHIAVQILEFSLSFESERHAIKTILFNALQSQPNAKRVCEQYVPSHGCRNLDHLLEFLVFDGNFAALVVMDKIPDKLENILAQKFKFGVEVLELSRYENSRGERVYGFEPFLADLDADIGAVAQTVVAETGLSDTVDFEEVDTVVVPAREDGFRDTFLAEDRWYAIRLHGTMRPQIKYIAVYQIRPISAITHVAPVKSIEPWHDTGKFVVNLSEPAQAINPIPLAKNGRVKGLQNLRYTTLARLQVAKTLDDLW